MTINNSYNFGLLTNDTSNSSINNLKSFTITLNSNGDWEVSSNLSDYFIHYYNKVQVSNGPGAAEYSGLVVYNTKGKNFIILVQNSLQLTITQSNFISFTSYCFYIIR